MKILIYKSAFLRSVLYSCVTMHCAGDILKNVYLRFVREANVTVRNCGWDMGCLSSIKLAQYVQVGQERILLTVISCWSNQLPSALPLSLFLTANSETSNPLHTHLIIFSDDSVRNERMNITWVLNTVLCFFCSSLLTSSRWKKCSFVSKAPEIRKSFVSWRSPDYSPFSPYKCNLRTKIPVNYI